MEYKNEKYSCLECIWHDQCGCDEICGFFDPGRLPTDEEIESETEILCQQYYEDYQAYLKGE